VEEDSAEERKEGPGRVDTSWTALRLPDMSNIPSTGRPGPRRPHRCGLPPCPGNRAIHRESLVRLGL
jgi:hypothetical protein